MFEQSLIEEINRHLKAANAEMAVPPQEMAPPPPEVAPEPPAPPALPQAIIGLLQVQYAVLLAYMTYGDQLQCIERDGLYEHFKTHADDIKSWIYELHRTLASMGMESYPQGVTVPTAPLKAARPAIEALLGLETQLLDGWANCAAVLASEPPPSQGELVALTTFFEDGGRNTLAHVQDLRRYLGGA